MRSLSILVSAAAMSSVSAFPALLKRANYDAPPQGDIDILNYALTLEYLERKFYQEGLAKYTVNDFCQAGFNGEFYKSLQEIYVDEQASGSTFPPLNLHETDPRGHPLLTRSQGPCLVPFHRPWRQGRQGSHVLVPLYRYQVVRRPLGRLGGGRRVRLHRGRRRHRQQNLPDRRRHHPRR